MGLLVMTAYLSEDFAHLTDATTTFTKRQAFQMFPMFPHTRPVGTTPRPKIEGLSNEIGTTLNRAQPQYIQDLYSNRVGVSSVALEEN